MVDQVPTRFDSDVGPDTRPDPDAGGTVHRPTLTRLTGSALGAALVVSVGVVGVASPAVGHGNEIGGSGDEFHLTNSWAGGDADVRFTYGQAGDQAYVGDWDGDGRDTIAIRRGQTFHVRNSNSSGPADSSFTYGRRGDVVLVGDWNGDGRDSFAVRRGDVYHIKNSLSGGEADAVVTYGRPGDQVLVGDWNGNGRDTLAVRRGDHYFLKNTITSGNSDIDFVYGRSGDVVYTGDWDGDGRDTFMVRRGVRYHMSNRLTGGDADRVVAYGRTDDTAFVGDWNRDGRDTLGIRREVVPDDPADAMLSYDRRMVELINEARRDHGVAPLQWRSSLRPGAVNHSRWMLTNSTFRHASNPAISADTAAAGCSGGWAENIFNSTGHPADPEIAMQGYMDSPGHRANILNPSFRYAATGTVQSGRQIYNTQRFAGNCG